MKVALSWKRRRIATVVIAVVAQVVEVTPARSGGCPTGAGGSGSSSFYSYMHFLKICLKRAVCGLIVQMNASNDSSLK